MILSVYSVGLACIQEEAWKPCTLSLHSHLPSVILSLGNVISWVLAPSWESLEGCGWYSVPSDNTWQRWWALILKNNDLKWAQRNAMKWQIHQGNTCWKMNAILSARLYFPVPQFGWLYIISMWMCLFLFSPTGHKQSALTALRPAIAGPQSCLRLFPSTWPWSLPWCWVPHQ